MKKISYGLLLLISFFCRGENIVFQENFDTAPNSKKWQLKFKSYPDKTYTASRILKKELSLQDFYWGGDIATAKSPEFRSIETSRSTSLSCSGYVKVKFWILKRSIFDPPSNR